MSLGIKKYVIYLFSTFYAIAGITQSTQNPFEIVDRLEEKGLVIRKQCKNDRRAVDVFISDKGSELLSMLDGKMSDFENATRKLSEEEAETLNALLDKMRQP